MALFCNVFIKRRSYISILVLILIEVNKLTIMIHQLLTTVSSNSVTEQQTNCQFDNS